MQCVFTTLDYISLMYVHVHTRGMVKRYSGIHWYQFNSSIYECNLIIQLLYNSKRFMENDY